MGFLGLASLLFTGVSIAQTHSAAKESQQIAEEQKKQGRAERALAEIRSRRSKMEILRRGRIARAQIISAAETSGAGKSSGALGGAAAVGSQTASAAGFLNVTEAVSQGIFASNQRITDLASSQADKLGRASIAGTIGSVLQPAQKGLFS
jgi:hypothetical protein